MTTLVLHGRTRPASARLPVFLDLAGRRVVVAGDSERLTAAIELLLAAGAKVVLYARHPAPDLVARAADLGGRLELVSRPWRDSDLDGAWLAVCAEPDIGAPAALAAAARRRGILVNHLDEPGGCDFQFGTLQLDALAQRAAEISPRNGERYQLSGTGQKGWMAMVADLFRQVKRRLPIARPWTRTRSPDVSFISQAQEDERLVAIEQLAGEILRRKG